MMKTKARVNFSHLLNYGWKLCAYRVESFERYYGFG